MGNAARSKNEGALSFLLLLSPRTHAVGGYNVKAQKLSEKGCYGTHRSFSAAVSALTRPELRGVAILMVLARIVHKVGDIDTTYCM